MLSLRHIGIIVFLFVFATACTKEAAVEPCSASSEHTEVNAKDLPSTIADSEVPDSHEGDTAEPGTDGNVDGDEPGGISDDGDDISDSEKTRKKRR